MYRIIIVIISKNIAIVNQKILKNKMRLEFDFT